jgi:hypothetical protein
MLVLVEDEAARPFFFQIPEGDCCVKTILSGTEIPVLVKNEAARPTFSQLARGLVCHTSTDKYPAKRDILRSSSSSLDCTTIRLVLYAKLDLPP